MPANQPRQYLICYDIRDPARLGRVHRFMTGVATALQYSVFTGFYTEAELSRVLGDLESIIDSRVDDVRAYPLPATPRAVSLGRGMFPRGILLVERGRDLLHDSTDGKGSP